MFKHLFKLIWNKRKQNALLIAEMLISFMVMFAVFTLIVNYYQNYKTPMGFEYKNVWIVNYQNNKQFNSTDSVNLYYETLRKTLKQMSNVMEVSYSGYNLPFANSTSNTGFDYKGKKINSINTYQVEDEYKNVLSIKVLEGRWFNKQDIATKNRPIVINASLRAELFGKGPALGKQLGYDEAGSKANMRVIGVVEDMKDKGDYYKSGLGVYNRIDTGDYKHLGEIVIKVTSSADATFESKLYKSLTNYMKDASIEIEHLTDKRENMNKATLIPVLVLLIISGFLIINVALGLFGVLWYNINKRKSEIGLRRAIGASSNSVSGQIVAEAMILATLSLIIGSFFAIQFPLMNVLDISSSVYFIALFLAILFIYLLVLICSLYPGKQAAAIYPAVALHEN